MRLFIDHKPIGKARPRFNTETGAAYDPQSTQKMGYKWIFAAQMREKGYKRLSKQQLGMTLTSYIPIPKSWSQRKKNALLGHPAICKPDVDNSVKFYCDVLNGIAYEDDAHISQLWTEKLYAKSPGVEITLTPLGGNMIQEHAKTVKGEITMDDLEFMVKKAHRMGLAGWQLTRVYSQEDGEGKHIYFECQCRKYEVPKLKVLC